MSAPFPLAPEVAAVVHHGTWSLVIDSAETSVWKVGFGGERVDAYVKVGVGAPAGPNAAVHAEHERLVWLHAHLRTQIPVPSVLGHHPGDDAHPAVLVTEALPGEADLRLLPDVDAAVGLLGRTLARLHALDAADVPFDAGPDTRLAQVTERIRAGLIDPEELPAGYHRIAPDRLVELLATMHPGPVPPEDLVLLHGDLCVTNLLFDPATGRASGLVDWRWSGRGDRHLDLATTARSVVRNFGAEVLPRLFEAYGMPHPDARRLDFYGVLEELS